jgi:hypothetical protein
MHRRTLSYEAAPLPAAWLPTCRQWIFCQPGEIAVALIDPSERLHSYQRFQGDPHLALPLFWELLCQDQPELNAPYFERQLFIADPQLPFLPLPALAWPGHTLLKLARLTLDPQLLSTELQASYCPHEDLQLAFAWPEARRRAWLRQWASCTYNHAARLLLAASHQLKTHHRHFALLYLLQGQVMAAAVKQQKLILCNTYPQYNGADARYFGQLVRQVTGLPPQAPLFVMGDYDPYNRLGRHWPEAQLPECLHDLLPHLPDSEPWWQLLPLAAAVKGLSSG